MSIKNGKLTWTSGRVYEGEYNEEKQPHGKGKMTFPGGEVHYGEFINGKANGVGRMTWPNGNIYMGMWKDNQRQGKGRYEWHSDDSTKDSVLYEGNAQVTGIKSKRSKKGNWYQGNWENDSPSGQGEFFFAHLGGATYKGEVSDWEPNGIGKMHWPTGSEYIGRVVRGAIDGEGLYISGKTGIVYDGTWRDDVRNGYMVMRDCTMKIIYAGNWENNRMVDADRVEDVIFLDGRRYSGGWVGNAPHGHGIMTWPDGTVQECEWQEGLPAGMRSAINGKKDSAGNGSEAQADAAEIINVFSLPPTSDGVKLPSIEAIEEDARRIGQETAKEMDAELKAKDVEALRRHGVYICDERGLVNEYYETDTLTGKRMHVVEYYFQGDHIIHKMFDPEK